MTTSKRIAWMAATSFIVTAVAAFASSNGGAWSPAIPGKGFKVNCGQSTAAGRDCEMSTGYCINGDSWCSQYCLDASGQPTFANSQAVRVLCVGANGTTTW